MYRIAMISVHSCPLATLMNLARFWVEKVLDFKSWILDTRLNECRIRIADCGIKNPKSEIQNPHYL